MKVRFVILAIAAATLTLSVLGAGGPAASHVVWLDFDMKDIPEPKPIPDGFYTQILNTQFSEQIKRRVDFIRYAREIAGKPKPAMNVNAMDEVPDSSWYTNRHQLRRMSTEALMRGPNRGAAPDLRNATITSAKTAGVTPGFFVKDSRGDTYLVKFDSADYPELQSAAEMISTKILFASGYNVPENYLAYFDPRDIRIADDVQFTADDGRKRPFHHPDLERLLHKAAQMPDGRYRVLASRILTGKPMGPFPQVGLRLDDPNDLIPHEHRRELRGLRVIASWINQWDMKQSNSLDMYVEEGGRHFLRHYLIDFGSSLGGGQFPLEYFHGREYAFDAGNTIKEIVSLGLTVTPSEKNGVLVSPSVGIFSAEDFDPATWRPSFPVMGFQNMTEGDALWATRIILAFSVDDLRHIIETGQYSHPGDAQYILDTLLKRRRMVAQHWLEQGSPLAGISVRPGPHGSILSFHDLMVEQNLSPAETTSYAYRFECRNRHSDTQVVTQPSINLDKEILSRLIAREDPNSTLEVKIWARRGKEQSQPLKVVLATDGEGFRLVQIVRG